MYSAHTEEHGATDIGTALTFQQQQQYTITGLTPRVFCIDLGFRLQGINEEQALKQRLHNIMASHTILRTRFIKPQGFTTLRQVIEPAALKWCCMVTGESTSEGWDEEATQQKAQQSYYANNAHLLAWYFPASKPKALNDNGASEADIPTDRLLLVGSSLAVDEGTIAHIGHLLTHPDDNLSAAIPDMQYTDYAHWISELQQDDDVEEAIGFWKGFKLNDFPPLQLNERQSKNQIILEQNAEANNDASLGHTDYQHCALSVPVALQQHIQQYLEPLEGALSEEILSLAIWAILLNRLTDNNDLYIHRYHDSRDDYEELSDVMGVFLQALPTPFYNIASLDLQRMMTGLAPVLEEQIDYQEYVQQLPLDNRVGFHYHNQEGLAITGCSMYHSSDLFLQYTKTEQGGAELQLHYLTRAYEKRVIERILSRYLLLFQAALHQPNIPVRELPCLLNDERINNENTDNTADNIANNSTQKGASYFLNTIHQHVINTPKAEALRDGNIHYSYEALWSMSDTVAAGLQQAGAKPEGIVALCLPRGADFLIALLAIIKTGAAYLPLDPTLPKMRLQQIISDANPVVMISEDGFSEQKLSEGDSTKVEINTPILSWSSLVNSTAKFVNPFIKVPENTHCLAYVLYTSGSTGVPKGVQVSYQALMHYSTSAIKDLDLPPKGHYGLISSLMADLGNTMIFPAWLQGGSLHILAQDLATDPQLFVRYMQTSPLDCLKIVPSHLSALFTGALNAQSINKGNNSTVSILPKQVLVLGGEGINNTLLTQLKDANALSAESASCRIYNHYGPTETTVGVMWQAILLEQAANSGASLTHPIGQNRIYLLDKQLNPTVTGQVSELYVAGPSLTRGYLNASAQTASAYLPNPFSSQGERMYRTGDLAMRREDGTVHIMGRGDHQVKVRGFRLDLLEIESLLRELPSVQQASIQVQSRSLDNNQSPQETQLVAFVVNHPNANNTQALSDPKALKQWLAQRLPEYMVPSQIWCVPHFPLNSNGKLDHKALLTWASEQHSNEYIAPSTPMETLVATVWENILQLEKVSITDNFFELGGHSLSAIKVVAALREALKRDLPTNVVFQAQTVQALALFIHNKTTLKPLQVISQASHSDAPTVVFMHNRGGHFDDYQLMIDTLRHKANIFGLYPDSTLLQGDAHNNFDALLNHYMTHLQALKNSPLILVGWSLAARQIMVLSERLVKAGFMIESLGLIDYNPHEKLPHAHHETLQLLDDIRYYFTSNNDIDLDESSLQSLEALLTKSDCNTYQQGLEKIVSSAEIQNIMGDKLPIELIVNRVLERWNIKKMFYAHPIPTVDIPLWVWHTNTNNATCSEWEAYTSHAIRAWTINANHFSILQSTALAQQLVECVQSTHNTEALL